MCSLWAIEIHAQYTPMVEEGKFWIYLNYYDSEDENSSESGHAITFRGDTMINGTPYKKVYKHQLKGFHTCPFPPCWQFDYPYQTESIELIAFVREDTISRKVYNLPLSPFGFCDSTEHLIFDFSLEVGDSVNSCIYDFINAGSVLGMTGGIVDSINSMEMFGRTRRTLNTTGFQIYLGDPPVGQVLIMEGIGLSQYGIFHQPLSLFVDFCEGSDGPCEVLTSSKTIMDEKDLTIYPNPTNGILQISSGADEVTRVIIYSMMGVIVTEFSATDQMDIRDLDAGIYAVAVFSKGNEPAVIKLVKGN